MPNVARHESVLVGSKVRYVFAVQFEMGTSQSVEDDTVNFLRMR